MRVITGTAGGTPLTAPKGQNTRPTADRVKEAMFGVIQFEIEGKSVLDLFAGSGALGIEALSRGAQSAVFVDEHALSIAAVKQNLAKTGFTQKSRVIKSGYQSALRTLQGEKFSLVFLDPPYRAGLYESALTALAEYGLLNGDAIIVLEKDENVSVEIPPHFTAFKEKRYGGTVLNYLKKV